MDEKFEFLVAGLLIGLCCSCPATTAAPLDVRPGISRNDAIVALADRGYCRGDSPVRDREIYPQCARPGARITHSWVSVEYAEGTLQRLQRYVRHDLPDQAARRWDDLVSRRSRTNGPPSRIARQRLREIRGVPPGAISWAAWYSSDFRILIGVYLLRPRQAGDPDILEEIIPAGPSDD